MAEDIREIEDGTDEDYALDRSTVSEVLDAVDAPQAQRA